MSVVSAPSPDEKARQCLASSSAARHSSRALRVGLPVREYSNPLCLPTPCWAKVVAMWMGCTTRRRPHPPPPRRPALRAGPGGGPPGGAAIPPTERRPPRRPAAPPLPVRLPAPRQLRDAIALQEVDPPPPRLSRLDRDQRRQ